MSDKPKTYNELVSEGFKELREHEHWQAGSVPYRSQCTCPCHTPEGRSVGMRHFTNCCEPDPKTS